jgi:hypothetical protein
MAGDGFNLDGVLQNVLRLASFEYAGPRELLILQMPGDWIRRATATPQELLAALADISSRELDRPFEFEGTNVNREVIVASGEFKLAPLRESRPSEVIMHLDQKELAHLDDDGGGGAAGITIDRLLRRLGDRVGIPVENRVSNELELDLKHLSSTRLRKENNKEEKARKLKALLANLSAQTALRFSSHQQRVHVWQLREKERAVGIARTAVVPSIRTSGHLLVRTQKDTTPRFPSSPYGGALGQIGQQRGAWCLRSNLLHIRRP